MKSIIKLRTQLGLTQQEFANVLNVTRTHLSMVEIGKRDFDSQRLLKIAVMESLLAERPQSVIIEKDDSLVSLAKKQEVQELAANFIDTKLQIHYLKRKLERRTRNYEKNLKRLHAFKLLTEKGLIESDGIINLKRLHAERELLHNNKSRQNQLSKQITSLILKEDILKMKIKQLKD